MGGLIGACSNVSLIDSRAQVSKGCPIHCSKDFAMDTQLGIFQYFGQSLLTSHVCERMPLLTDLLISLLDHHTQNGVPCVMSG